MVALRVRDHRRHAAHANAQQLLRCAGRYVHARKLHERRAGITEVQMLRAQVRAGRIEHDLPAEHELRHRRRVLDEIGENRAMPLDGRARGIGRLEVRRAHEHRHAILAEALEHRHGHFHRRRAVVDTRQQMRVDVDHARAATVSAPSTRGPPSSSAPPMTTMSAPASRAARTASDAANAAAHEQRTAPRRARAANHRCAHRARRAASRIEIRRVHADERRRTQMRRRDLRLVRGQRARLAHALHRRHVSTIDETVGRADRLHIGMPLEERHRAHVLLDEILRVAPGYQREQQHRVDVRVELRRHRRKLHERQLRRGALEPRRKRSALARGTEAVAEQE